MLRPMEGEGMSRKARMKRMAGETGGLLAFVSR
jgi:hypothetical protein